MVKPFFPLTTAAWSAAGTCTCVCICGMHAWWGGLADMCCPYKVCCAPLLPAACTCYCLPSWYDAASAAACHFREAAVRDPKSVWVTCVVGSENAGQAQPLPVQPAVRDAWL